MKKIIFIIAILLLSVGCNKKSAVNIQPPPPAYNYIQKLRVGSSELYVELPKTSEEFQLGLSNRESMAENNGMLFDFGINLATPSFWMKDMKFNIDIIWIAQNKIVGITENVPAPIKNFSSQSKINLPLFTPPVPINQVLEVNAGWSNRNNVKIGEEIKIIN